MKQPDIQISDLDFAYRQDDGFRLAVKDLCIYPGEKVFLEGPSGTGKSTLLNLLTGLLQQKSANISVLGTPISTLSRAKVDQFRADHFGIIFQMFNLIGYLSAVENIALQCSFSEKRRQTVLASGTSIHDEAVRLCKALDLDADLIHKNARHLSIGQQQRVAIARALIGGPQIVIADEPTSALDTNRKDQFIDILLNECEKYKCTLLFVSHDPSLKSHFDRVISMQGLTADKERTPVYEYSDARG